MEILNEFLKLDSINISNFTSLQLNIAEWLFINFLKDGKFDNAIKLNNIIETERHTSLIRFVTDTNNYKEIVEIIRKYILTPMNKENLDAFYYFLLKLLEGFDTDFSDEVAKIPGIYWERIKLELVRKEYFYPLMHLIKNKIVNLTTQEATKLFESTENEDIEYLLVNYPISYASIVKVYKAAFNDGTVNVLEIIDENKPITVTDKGEIVDEYINPYVGPSTGLIHMLAQVLD
jgi:hypothetical protein